MTDEALQTGSALEAWAGAVMSGSVSGTPQQDSNVDRAPGQAHYDPADVISVFMSARESAKERHAIARRSPSRTRGRAQPS
jgi:hypothetical protein